MGGVGRYYNGKWYAMGSGVDFAVTALGIGKDKTVYAGGGVSSGVPSKGIIVGFNGSSWFKLGDGGPQYRDGDNFDGSYRLVASIVEDHNGDLIVGGSFTQTPGLKFNDKIARFSKSAWFNVPIDLPGDPTVYAIHVSKSRHLALGFSTLGNFISQSYTLTTNVSGDAPTYPFVRVTGGGTLQLIRNNTTGQEVNFKYTLLVGEILILDLRPGKIAAHSNYFGDVSGRVWADGSDLSLVLLPGVNDLSSFMSNSTSQAAGITLYWNPAYKGLD
jgi:hypothetical protein